MKFRALNLLVSDPETFLKAIPRDPDVFIGDPERMRSLFGYGDVDDLLSSRSARVPNFALLNSSMPAPTRAYTDQKFPTSDVADPLAVAAYLQNGYSITFNQLHSFLPSLGTLASRLEYEVGCPVEVTAFVTPPGAKALTPHHDTMSSFLCQTEGTKNWKLYRPVQPDPHPHEEWDWAYLDAGEKERILSGPPDLEISLTPGMCLWLPRGWVHTAEVASDSQTSVHLTVEIRRESRYWLARQLMDYLSHIPFLRADIPPSQTSSRVEEDKTANFLSLLSKAVAETDAQDFRRYLRQQHHSRFRGPHLRPIRDVLESDSTDVGNAVARLEGVRGYEMDGGLLHLHLGGAERTFADAEARFLLSVLENEPEGALLPSAAQELGDDAAQRFVRVLLALGLARLPEDTP